MSPQGRSWTLAKEQGNSKSLRTEQDFKHLKNSFHSYCFWPFLESYNSSGHTRGGKQIKEWVSATCCNFFDIIMGCYDPLPHMNQGQKRHSCGAKGQERNFGPLGILWIHLLALFVSLKHLCKHWQCFLWLWFGHSFNLIFIFFIEESSVCPRSQRGKNQTDAFVVIWLNSAHLCGRD